MQAALNNTSALENFRFARGRDYMMRSEKRSGSGPAHRSPASGGKPPRRRRRRAGFFYKLFMMILLLTIWPLGLLMLWRRKVRWGIPTKLLTSVVTLAACVILIGFALTVNTGNAQYTAVQDSVNNFLDTAADTLVDAGDIVAEHAEIMFEDMNDVADALWEKGKVHVANGIDAGIALTQQARTEVLDLIEQIRTTPAPTPEETVEETPQPQDTQAAESEATVAPESGDPDVNPADSDLPVYIPEDTPEAEGNDVTEGTLTRAGELAEETDEALKPTAEATKEPAEETSQEPTQAPAEEASEAPAIVAVQETAGNEPAEETPAGEPTAEPASEATAAEATAGPSSEATAAPAATPEPQLVVPSAALKPAGEATVYHSTNGQWYHTFNRCSGMTGGGAYTLAECAATHKQCKACGAPGAELIGQPCLWKDEMDICHTSDECITFSGKYTLILRDDALEQGYHGCTGCGGNEYLVAGTAIDYDAITPAAQ